VRANKVKVGEMDLADEAKQKELAQKDEEEDFLDECKLSMYVCGH
jgi:hypothetical protein